MRNQLTDLCGRTAQQCLPDRAKSGLSGVYHVLLGALSPLEGIGPDQLQIRSLRKRLEKDGADELILATNPTVQGRSYGWIFAERASRFSPSNY